jgi:hypothetical protein
MFRLNEALRNWRGQVKTAPTLQGVATTVASLSPRPASAATRVVATVAVVAKNPAEDVCIEDLVDQLRGEGAELFYLDNQLCLRPMDWNHFHRASDNWRDLLAYLHWHEEDNQNGSGRQA